jgi:hypothetical protein
MCLMVYLAADRPMPLVPQDEARPVFFVRELLPRDEGVRAQFSRHHVYYAGAYENCGCGFQYGEYPGMEEPEQVARAQQSRRALVQYLRQALSVVPAIDLFACWDGDQAEAPLCRSKLRPDDLVKGRTFFQERELVEFV